MDDSRLAVEGPHLAETPAESPLFPGWRWAAVALAFPIAGLIGWTVGGHVDAVGAALIGGALTGAGLGAAQWLAAKDMFGQWPAWVGASAVGYAVGLAAGAALVGYETDIGSLAAMGAVSGIALGGAQGLNDCATNISSRSSRAASRAGIRWWSEHATRTSWFEPGAGISRGNHARFR